jgi:hypothetical protein
MILDKENLFSEDQAITATAVSTNVIDLDKAGMGKGEPVYVFAQVTEDFATLTSLQIDVQTDTVAAFSSPTTLQGASVAVAGLTAGKQIPLGILTGDVEQFVRLNYTVTGSNATAGKFVSGLTLDVQTNV